MQRIMKHVSGFLLFALLLLFSSETFAQQEAHFSHHMFNNMGFNPGYAGLRSAISTTALARQQWVGFKDEDGNRLSPETYMLNVDAPIPLIRGGLALGFMQDQLGFEKNTGVRLTYSWHKRLYGARLGIGAQVGFLDKAIDFSGFKPIQPGDPVLIGGDESYMFTDFGLGVFYLTDDNIYAGLSVSQLSQPRGYLGQSNYSLSRHYYATAGYQMTLPGRPEYAFSPSVLIKSDLKTVQFDLNAMLTYNNRFWGGVSYRLQDAMVVMLGLQYEQIGFGYAYDITTSALGAMGRSYGSHEIMIRYSFKLDIDKIQEIQRNIRFL